LQTYFTSYCLLLRVRLSNKREEWGGPYRRWKPYRCACRRCSERRRLLDCNHCKSLLAARWSVTLRRWTACDKSNWVAGVAEHGNNNGEMENVNGIPATEEDLDVDALLFLVAHGHFWSQIRFWKFLLLFLSVFVWKGVRAGMKGAGSEIWIFEIRSSHFPFHIYQRLRVWGVVI